MAIKLHRIPGQMSLIDQVLLIATHFRLFWLKMSSEVNYWMELMLYEEDSGVKISNLFSVAENKLVLK